MFEEIIQGLKPYLEKGFIDEITSADHVGPDAIVVKAGNASVVANLLRNSVEVSYGDNKAAILSGVAPAQVIQFIVQALGRATFRVPVNVTASFKVSPFPSEFADAVLGPVGITAGPRVGVFNAVYKDARGRYYIHEDEARVSLKLYKELYDRNSESEMLRLARLFSSETAPVLTRDYTLVSEALADHAVAKMGLVPIMECAKKGIPVRIASAVTPKSGYIAVQGTNYEVTPLGADLLEMALGWETTLTGKIPQRPPAAAFSSVQVEVKNVIPATKRAELEYTFSAKLPIGVVTEKRSKVVSAVEAEELFKKLDENGMTTDAAFIEESLKASNFAKVETVPIQSRRVQSITSAAVVSAKGSDFVLKVDGKDGEIELSKFVKESKVPAWLSQSSSFVMLQVK